MSANEIKEKIERLENWMYWEQFADFMNWSEYYKAKAEVRELKRQLAELEAKA